jgi:hypothetical protein
MATKIIREPTNIFVMECQRCECAFTYQREDLVKYISCYYVKCPYCKDEISHNLRKKDVCPSLYESEDTE